MKQDKPQEIKFTLTGKPNVGDTGHERTLEFTVKQTNNSCIHIKDSEGKILVSFNPFMDGGSIWITDFSSLIMDVEKWGDDKDGKFKCLHTTNFSTSSIQVQQWKEDSEKLAKIREARKLILEDD